MKAMGSRGDTIRCLVCNKVIMYAPRGSEEDAANQLSAHHKVIQNRLILIVPEAHRIRVPLSRKAPC